VELETCSAFNLGIFESIGCALTKGSIDKGAYMLRDDKSDVLLLFVLFFCDIFLQMRMKMKMEQKGGCPFSIICPSLHLFSDLA
jgi:hypothetical protein